jgi:hypothetical protein
MSMGYWRYETSGLLRRAVEAYLDGGEMTPAQIAAMRAYLRQWIFCPFWKGEELDYLRGTVGGLVDREGIARWIDDAIEAGIDPI